MEAFQQALSYDPGAQVLVAKAMVVAMLLFYTGAD